MTYAVVKINNHNLVVKLEDVDSLISILTSDDITGSYNEDALQLDEDNNKFLDEETKNDHNDIQISLLFDE